MADDLLNIYPIFIINMETPRYKIEEIFLFQEIQKNELTAVTLPLIRLFL